MHASEPKLQNYFQIENVLRSYGLCSKPDEDHLKKAGKELRKALRDCLPQEQYFIHYKYELSTLEEKCLSKKCKLGSLQVRKSLSTLHAQIAFR